MEHWERVLTYPSDLADPLPQVVHPARRPEVRRCNFCLRSKPEARFRSTAHVIPYAFGRPRLTSRAECDECNARGSRLENDLALSLALHRALSGHVGRDGHPTIYVNKNSYMVWDPEKQGTRVHLYGGDFVRKGGVSFEVPPYRPMNVCRALARMALFFVEQPECYPKTRAWVQEAPGSCRAMSLMHFEFDRPLPRPLLVIKRRRFGENEWYRTTFGFHTALLVMCVGEPDWAEPSPRERNADFTLPPVGNDEMPSGKGLSYRFSTEDAITTPFDFAPGAIRRPPEIPMDV